jgi:hypothetical protein
MLNQYKIIHLSVSLYAALQTPKSTVLAQCSMGMTGGISRPIITDDWTSSDNDHDMADDYDSPLTDLEDSTSDTLGSTLKMFPRTVRPYYYVGNIWSKRPPPS